VLQSLSKQKGERDTRQVEKRVKMKTEAQDPQRTNATLRQFGVGSTLLNGLPLQSQKEALI